MESRDEPVEGQRISVGELAEVEELAGARVDTDDAGKQVELPLADEREIGREAEARTETLTLVAIPGEALRDRARDEALEGVARLALEGGRLERSDRLREKRELGDRARRTEVRGDGESERVGARRTLERCGDPREHLRATRRERRPDGAPRTRDARRPRREDRGGVRAQERRQMHRGIFARP